MRNEGKKSKEKKKKNEQFDAYLEKEILKSNRY